MSRSIITKSDLQPFTASATAGRAREPKIDGYRDKLVKLIPAEVVAVYITADLLIRSSKSSAATQLNFSWFLFLFLLIATPFYLNRVQSVHRRIELVLPTIAFGIWVFAMGGPFLSFDWVAENRVAGALAIVIYTFAIPIIDPDTGKKLT